MAKKKNDSPTPGTPSSAYQRMLPFWRKIETLLAGTEAMRAAGEEYLPRHEEESFKAFDERRNRATLLNVTQMTLDSWVGRPFGDPVKIGDDVPDSLRAYMSNVDLQGSDITTFSRAWFRDGLAKGFSHVLVEFPKPQPRADGKPRTLEDDNREQLRPYFVHIKPENLIFAEATHVDGKEVLTHVRIREEHVTRDGWGEKCEIRIRVIEPGSVRIYREDTDPRTDEKTYHLIEEYPYSLKFIPLATFYADRQSFMFAKPPLSDLADLNILHFQSSSDQNMILTVARFPILAVSGAVDTDEMTIGPYQWLYTQDPAGRFYYVEHDGKAIESGRQYQLDLEETMAEFGATFLKKRPGGASATARALDSAEVTSPLQDMAIRFQNALRQAMTFMGAWMKISDSEVGTLSINVDFGLSAAGESSLTALSEARKNRDISRYRYLNELHRHGVLGDDFDPEANDEELEDENSALPAGSTQQELDPGASE